MLVQIVALLALSAESSSWERWLSVAFVMAMQALSGVAKDLTKMSSKSAVKTVAGDGSLFRLVAILTGSKNALKGVGFFLGAALLASLGYEAALWTLAAIVGIQELGIANQRHVTCDNCLDDVGLQEEPVKFERVLR